MDKSCKDGGRTPVIVGMARTPVGDFMGGLSAVGAVELGTVAAGGALARCGVAADQIQEVHCGTVYKAGLKGNPARQIQLALGCPAQGVASTVDQQCASGMRAFELACQSIQLGKAAVCLAVGTESMSNVPHLLFKGRGGTRMGDITLKDALTHDALHDAMLGYHMGLTAERLAEDYGVTRQQQDVLAVESHARAAAAAEKGLFAQEIVPVEVKGRRGQVTVVDRDEHPRPGLSIQDIEGMRPAFQEGGTVTAANASGVNDGAAALVLMSEAAARARGLAPLARVVATASVGVPPEVMGIGPAYAIPKVLEYAGLALGDVGYFEINEAFAAQFLAVNRELDLSMDKVNANGSGISLGHPVGCTGVRILVALLAEMRRRGERYGIASLCVGGGPAMATLVEMERGI